MKITFLSLCLLITSCCNAQSIETVNQNLIRAFAKINADDYDSLDAANNNFEKLLLNYTSANENTITYNFKDLIDSGLNIQTSKDGLFRIYSWDDMSGGTMCFFRNVFQYKTGDKVYSKTLDIPTSDEEVPDMGYNYIDVNHVVSQGKSYYVAQSYAKASSANYLFNIKIFSIDDGILNDTAKLIMTKSGLHNELSYEVDWSESSNQDNPLDRSISSPNYDAKNNIISIPLIRGDGKVTSKKIKYRFNGRYFVKM